jgi:hypothetical protein
LVNQTDARSIELADTVQKTWGVARVLQLIDEHGYDKVRSVHERLVERHRLGKLSRIRSLSGYFVESLRSEVVTANGPERYVESRSDEFIERYMEKKRARGQRA